MCSQGEHGHAATLRKQCIQGARAWISAHLGPKLRNDARAVLQRDCKLQNDGVAHFPVPYVIG